MYIPGTIAPWEEWTGLRFSAAIENAILVNTMSPMLGWYTISPTRPKGKAGISRHHMHCEWRILSRAAPWHTGLNKRTICALT